MILLLGKSGFIGQAFVKELEKRGMDFIGLSRKVRDYTNPNEFCRIMDEGRGDIDLVICAAAYIPTPSVSLCDQHIWETIQGNVILPTNLVRVCEIFDVPLAMIGTACLWSDELMHSEEDPPQRAFKGHCGFYVGTKVMAEKEVLKYPKSYIWRVRLPFDQFDSDRNYLTKLATYAQVWEQNNSCSHRGDFVKACLDLWKVRGAPGIYNVTNPGYLNSATVLREMQRRGMVKDHEPEILKGRTEGQCRVSCQKLQAAGVKIRPVEEALQDSLDNWIERG